MKLLWAILLLLLSAPGCITTSHFGGDQPRDVVEMHARAIENADANSLYNTFHVSSPEQERMVRAYADLAIAERRLAQAVQQRIGRSANIESITLSHKSDAGLERLRQANRSADIKTTADGAVLYLDFGTERDQINLDKVNGRWQINFDSFFHETEPLGVLHAGSRATQYIAQTAIARKTLAELQANPNANVAAVVQRFNAEFNHLD